MGDSCRRNNTHYFTFLCRHCLRLAREAIVLFDPMMDVAVFSTDAMYRVG